ncbi:hypothetical protein [Spiroplasma endosymbiont of Glossina fuscipes fuscipes]|uniref:hypothetical protein n=1 Tax=Spiroplasma endosymbiont of Glossina fuscipes fuscipes TaxID=2004463 RepID=UPI003C7657B2
MKKEIIIPKNVNKEGTEINFTKRNIEYYGKKISFKDEMGNFNFITQSEIDFFKNYYYLHLILNQPTKNFENY